MADKNYTSSDIQVLSDRDHVRKRTAMYLGNMHDTDYQLPIFENDSIKVKDISFTPAVLKSFGELVDNSIDEFNQIYSKRHKLLIDANTKIGKYTITDNGRGIPIDIHDSGKYTPELALANLRSGRNFEDDKKSGVIGMNGIGASAINFVSKEFLVKINREDKEYTQVFENGCDFIGKPIIQKGPKKTGTSVTFTLDDGIFNNVALPEELIREKCRALAFTNPSIEVVYNKESFKYKNGLDDIISKFDAPYFKFSRQVDDKIFEFFVVFGVNKNENEQIFTWLNSSLLFDGGSCNTQFINAFTDKVIKHLEREAKKQKCKVTRNDVKEKLLIFGNIKISDPEFDSQAKTRLVGPSLRWEMDQLIGDMWSQFARKNKEWFEVVLENAHRRHHTRANTKAISDHLKVNRKRVDGFKDATSKNRKECTLLITEGLCIDANQKIKVLHDGEVIDRRLKDVKSGNTVITRNHSFKRVLNVSKSLRQYSNIKSSLGIHKMSKDHQIFVYDINDKVIKCIKVEELDKNNHKLLKSKMSDFSHISTIEESIFISETGKYDIIHEYGRITTSSHNKWIIINNDLTLSERTSDTLIVGDKLIFFKDP